MILGTRPRIPGVEYQEIKQVFFFRVCAFYLETSHSFKILVGIPNTIKQEKVTIVQFKRQLFLGSFLTYFALVSCVIAKWFKTNVTDLTRACNIKPARFPYNYPVKVPVFGLSTCRVRVLVL